MSGRNQVIDLKKVFPDRRITAEDVEAFRRWLEELQAEAIAAGWPEYLRSQR